MLRALLLDFDGVIKESLAIKTRAFTELFAPWGPKAQGLAQAHHTANGGISRYKKIPLYLKEYCRVEPDATLVKKLLDEFAQRVVEAVIASPFVPGVRELIEKARADGLRLAIVSGTPEDEMRLIVERAGLSPFFDRVYGSPRDKASLLALTVRDFGLKPAGCLFIGDSINDWEPASQLAIPFVGRLLPTGENSFPPGVVTIPDFLDQTAQGLFAKARLKS